MARAEPADLHGRSVLGVVLLECGRPRRSGGPSPFGLTRSTLSLWLRRRRGTAAVSSVGRDRGLAQAVGLLDEAGAGHSRLVLCTGEAGIGKTRLAEETAAVAAAGNRGPGGHRGRSWKRRAERHVVRDLPEIIGKGNHEEYE